MRSYGRRFPNRKWHSVPVPIVHNDTTSRSLSLSQTTTIMVSQTTELLSPPAMLADLTLTSNFC